MASVSIIMSRNSENGARVRSLRMPKYSHITTESFRRKYDILCAELEIKSLITVLQGRNILTQNDMDRINLQTHRRRKAAAFLDVMLARDNDEWIDGVLMCLEQSNSNNIIQHLEGTNNAVSQIQYPIRELRPTQVEHRIWVEDTDITNAIQINQDAQILEDARDTLEFSIVNIYDGSLCFLLDALSDTAILEMWRKDKNIPRIRLFLKKLFSKYQSRPFLHQKRQIKVEISERDNDFIFRVNDRETRAVEDIKPSYCSGCFRKTVLDSYHIILDEVETPMIEKTFTKGIVPGCIRTACIDEKHKRSRLERADIFLQFVLTSEKLLMEFKNIFSSMSEIKLHSSNCALHTRQIIRPLKLREKIVLYFEVSYNQKDDILTVTSINKELRKSWPSSDALDGILQSIDHQASACTNGIRVVVIAPCKLDANFIAQHLFQVDMSELSKKNNIEPDSWQVVEPNFMVQFTVTTASSTMFSGDYPDAIAQCIAMTSPGPHIVLIAIPTPSQFDPENFDELSQTLTNVFGKAFEQYFLPVFINYTQENIIHYGQSSQLLQGLFERGRYLSYFSGFNRNKLILDLLTIIEQIKLITGNQFFTNEVYAETEKLFELRSRDYDKNRLEEYRQQECEIATLKERLYHLEHEQRKIKDSNTRKSFIQNEKFLSNISDLIFKKMRLTKS